MTREADKTKRVWATVETSQFMDLTFLEEYPNVLLPGWEIECQLVLWLGEGAALVAHAPNELAWNVGHRVHPFIVQPIEMSPICHVMAPIKKVTRHNYPKGAGRKEVSIIECLLEPQGITILVETRARAYIEPRVPDIGEIAHACGALYCLPSFCNYELFKPVKARIVEARRFSKELSREGGNWGTLSLNVDPRIKHPRHRVSNLS